MERYSEYKDSGEQWLGEIPSHWNCLPIRYIFSQRNECVGKNSDKYTLLSLTLNGVIKRDMDNPTGKFPSSFDTYKIVRRGDFIFCMFDNEETPRAFGLSHLDGMITGAYDVMHLDSKLYLESYLNYYFLNVDNGKELKPLYKGLRKTVPLDAFLSLKIMLPPSSEQSAIVAYLDRVTSQLDEAIAQQQRMIDLLNERKQIIIQHAVTKGLDPKAEMVESGVEWIGRMPRGWKLIKIKYLAKLQSGTNLTSLEILDSGEYPVYGGNGLRGYYNTFNCNGSYVLIGRQGALCGNINYGEGKFWATEHAVVCYPKMKFETFWFGEVLRVMNLGQYSQASAQPGLAVEKIKNLVVPCPSYEEQKIINSYLKREVSIFNNGIEKCLSSITLLRERKQIIINEVVTGKVKVS